MTVGERIKKLRILKGLTQEELGEILGVTKASVQKYESGQIRNLKADTIRKLCKTFDTLPIYFVFDFVEDHSPKDVKDMLVQHYGPWIMEFLAMLNEMNEDGQKRLLEYCKDLKSIENYRKSILNN